MQRNVLAATERLSAFGEALDDSTGILARDHTQGRQANQIVLALVRIHQFAGRRGRLYSFFWANHAGKSP